MAVKSLQLSKRSPEGAKRTGVALGHSGECSHMDNTRQALVLAASVARMKCNEIRGTGPPSISLRAIVATKSTLYAVFSRLKLGERE